MKSSQILHASLANIKYYRVNLFNSLSLALCCPSPVFGLGGRVQRSFKVMLRSQVKNVAGHYYAGIVEKQALSFQLRFPKLPKASNVNDY